MRIIIDSLIGLMFVAVIVGVVVLNYDRKQDDQDVTQLQSALERLHEQAAYHTAVQSAMEGKDTMLVHIHQAWFGENLPTNVLLEAEHPWIDLAPPGDLGIHPPDPVVMDAGQAGFWYNPTTGVFRARVVPGASEAETLALYNEVNGSSLDMFEQMPDASRKPIAHVLGKTPAMQYASMANLSWSQSERPKEPAVEPESESAPAEEPEPLLSAEDEALLAAHVRSQAAEAQAKAEQAEAQAKVNAGSDPQSIDSIVDPPAEGSESDSRPTLFR